MEDTEGKIHQRNERGKKKNSGEGAMQGVCATGAAGPHGVPKGIDETEKASYTVCDAS